ncbi:TetR/AcrR family transcriptional regulator [Oceanobacillus sp. CAU 1775]
MTTEELIIKSAVKLFSQKGYAATSIRDIAAETELTSSTLYYYVKGKDQLLILIMEKYLKMLLAETESMELESKSPDEALASLIGLHVRTHGTEQLPALVVDTEYRSMVGEDREVVKGLRNEYEEKWLRVLERGVEEEVFNIPDVKVTAYALIQMCTGVAHWYVEGKRFSIEDVINQYMELGLQMVGAKAVNLNKI